MNISRGLLRLWVLLSVLWIGGTGKAVFSDWRAAVEADRVAVVSSRAASVTRPVPKQSDVRLDVETMLRLAAQGKLPPPPAPSVVAMPPTWADTLPEVLDHPAAQPDAKSSGLAGTLRAEQAVAAFWAASPTMAVTMFLPPLVLLLAGITLRWVARGFRG